MHSSKHIPIIGIMSECLDRSNRDPVPWKFLGIYIVGQDPSDSKSNRNYVDIIFPVFLHSFEVYSIDSSKMIGKFPEVSNFNW